MMATCLISVASYLQLVECDSHGTNVSEQCLFTSNYYNYTNFSIRLSLHGTFPAVAVYS